MTGERGRHIWMSDAYWRLVQQLAAKLSVMRGETVSASETIRLSVLSTAQEVRARYDTELRAAINEAEKEG